MEYHTTKSLLKKHQAKPQKHLGQSFLVDQRILAKILAASELTPRDTVLEIGPGAGILTQALAAKAKKVVAVEKDPRMVQILKETLEARNVEIIQGDILSLAKDSLAKLRDYKVVANIPYYITSPIIRLFLEQAKRKPRLLVLMVQKEVAQRICAKPPHMNLLAVSVQFYAKPEIVSYVSKGSFWPSPKVDSAILKITPHEHPKVGPERFFQVVRAGFKQPRKQLAGNLSKGLRIPKKEIEQLLLAHNIAPTRRAETLSLQDWLNLV